MINNSKLDLWNMALSAAQANILLSGLDDQSREREECELWYPRVVETVQAAAHWSCCEGVSHLGLLGIRDETKPWRDGDPVEPYKYLYALPQNILRPWYLSHYGYFRTYFHQTRKIAVLATDEEQAVLTYSTYNWDVNFWPAGMKEAVVHGLAAKLAGSITGKRWIINDNLEIANRALLDAQFNSLSEDNTVRRHVIPEPIRQRGYAYEAEAPQRYIYPYGSVFTSYA